MAKQSGLGMNCYIDGYNVSGDVGSIRKLNGGMKGTLPQTGIDKYAYERTGGIRDGAFQYNAWYNPTGIHIPVSLLPTADVQATITTGTLIGSAAASVIAKQLNYDATRGNDGSLSFQIDCDSTNYGLEWGNLLTAGLRTDTTATNGVSNDYGAATSFGWRGFLHITAFTGTNITITIQDSADNASFAGFTSSAFALATGIGAQRIFGAAGSTVRRYVRVITSGTFTSCTFAVNFMKPSIADVVF